MSSAWRSMRHSDDDSGIRPSEHPKSRATGPEHVSSPAPIYDVFVDLSQAPCDDAALRAHLDGLAHDAGLAGIAGRITLAVAQPKIPPPLNLGIDVDAVAGKPAIEVLARAVRMAARARRHLVVLLGAVAPGNEVIARLIAGFAQDPMFGTAQPRFADPATDLIWPIPGGDARAAGMPMTSRASLVACPPDVITPELPACCLVLRWELLIGVESADHAGRSLTGGLLHLLAMARRLGFRNLVRNRVVVGTSLGYADIYPSAATADTKQLYAIDEYAAGTRVDLGNLSQRRAEALLAAARPDADGRLRLLLDCRGIPALHNGTSICMLGFFDGFSRLDTNWNIDVLAFAATLEYHGIARRYPRFRLLTDAPRGTYAAAVTMSQPWELGRVAELHRHAFLTAFLMLDVIAWDIFPGRVGMEATWHLIARHADGLFYISHFTRERFNTRFPVAPGVGEAVTHLSFARGDYLPSVEPADPIVNQILVFGNHFDHKHLGPTAQLLADAFPFHKITVLGMKDAPADNVTALASGNLPRGTLDRLIAGAGVIVFPSFYEGFGLPVVEGLARGRTVLVRRSALWTEIAAHSRLPGRLCEFDDPSSLVDGVGRALAGRPVTALPSGSALADGAEPADWPVCARRMIDLFSRRLASPALDHWWAREHALRMIGQ
jgi:glycosyltransferase involved in cell wall biosynthesis